MTPATARPAWRGPGAAVTLLGADGCRGGWIAAVARAGEPISWRLFQRFAELLALVEPAGALACVDVPIGLGGAGRRCDREARRLLEPSRACSVFTPPSRAALAAPSPEEMRRRNVAATGRSLSAQALGIAPKIREVDAVMTPALQRQVRETHPELVFASLARDGRGLAAGKKTAQGRRARLALLPRRLAAAAPGRAGRPFPAALVALDDYVDALAALVAADRLARGAAHRVPDGHTERDERGLAMEILW